MDDITYSHLIAVRFARHEKKDGTIDHIPYTDSIIVWTSEDLEKGKQMSAYRKNPLLDILDRKLSDEELCYIFNFPVHIMMDIHGLKHRINSNNLIAYLFHNIPYKMSFEEADALVRFTDPKLLEQARVKL